MRRRPIALLCGLAADRLLPELPNRLHPVVWMGRWLKLGERLAPRTPARRLGWGAAWGAAGMALSAAAARALEVGVAAGGTGAASVAARLIEGGVAQTLFAYRALDAAVGEVADALKAGDLPEARRLLAWHLVSRPTAELDEAGVAAAAIESLAENLADSVVAPLLWYAIGGLPALAAYRFANTADAMWGYRTPRFEHLGKFAARCDDILNAAPARLTALLLALTAGQGGAAGTRAERGQQGIAGNRARGRGASGANASNQLSEEGGAGGTHASGQSSTAGCADSRVRAWQVARRDHGRTASPNAGWPMAAMAGALDTRLTKVGHYALGDGPRRPDASLIDEARRHARRAVLAIAAGLALAAVVPPSNRHD